MNDLFPEVKKSLCNLIEDEEGTIPGNKLLMIGTMIIILGSLMTESVFAKHRSHSSHRSHNSHSSHGNHSNHGSHQSHQSHQSHTSHSNTASHSNSMYSAEGNVGYPAPSINNVPGVNATANTNVTLPEISFSYNNPGSTPITNVEPTIAIPPETEKIK